MHNWDKKRIRVYKCGKVPQVGDLVYKTIFGSSQAATKDCYGIVTGKQKLPTGLVMPVILWCGHGKPKRCISKNVELVVRNGND